MLLCGHEAPVRGSALACRTESAIRFSRFGELETNCAADAVSFRSNNPLNQLREAVWIVFGTLDEAPQINLIRLYLSANVIILVAARIGASDRVQITVNDQTWQRIWLLDCVGPR